MTKDFQFIKRSMIQCLLRYYVIYSSDFVKCFARKDEDTCLTLYIFMSYKVITILLRFNFHSVSQLSESVGIVTIL